MRIARAESGVFRSLVFLLAVFLGSEFVRMSRTYQFLHLSWTDALATYGLIGLAGTVALVPVSFVMSKVVRIRSRLLFCLVVVSVFNVFRLTAAAFGLTLAAVAPSLQLMGCITLAALMFPRFQTRFLAWFEESAPRMGNLGLGSLVFFVLSALFLFLEPLGLGRSSRAGPPGPLSRGAQPPNVIVVILDALTVRDMSLYGYHLPTTPRLNALAKEWTVYRNAHAAGTGTVANLPTVLTGRYPVLDDYSRYGDLVDEGQGWMSLPRVLASAGYETVCLLSAGPPAPSIYHLHKDFTRIVGGGRWRGGVRDRLNSTRFNSLAPKALVEQYALPPLSFFRTGSLHPPRTTLAEPTYTAAEAYVREATGIGRPFFLYAHMTRPHNPYLANELMGRFLPLEEGLTDADTQLKIGTDGVYPAEQQTVVDRLRLRYDENILKADQQVGELVDTLRESGAYDRTLLVITADHGHNFTAGRLGAFTDRLTAAEEHIPLLVKYPHQTTGTWENRLVSPVDLLPTIMDAAGLSYPSGWTDGHSMLRPEVPGRIVYSRRPHIDATIFAAISGQRKLVNRQEGIFLFDLTDDPQEQQDLRGKEGAGELERALQAFGARMMFVRQGGAILQAPPLVNADVTGRRLVGDLQGHDRRVRLISRPFVREDVSGLFHSRIARRGWPEDRP